MTGSKSTGQPSEFATRHLPFHGLPEDTVDSDAMVPRSHLRHLHLLLLLSGSGLSACRGESEQTRQQKALQKSVQQLLETRECAGCELTGAQLEGADLEGTRLVGATLENAKLARARLRNADLSGASLGGADARGADLRGARVDGASFGAAQFQGAILEGLDLRKVTELPSANFEGANLRGINLEGASLTGTGGPYRRSEPSHAYSLSAGGAWLVRADFTGAKLRFAVLARCNLEGAIFRDADLRDADLTHSNLKDVELQGARLSDALWEDGRKCASRAQGSCHLAPR
jgi:uncharacterized protein YjbI with pentapeptide repeats